MKLRVIVLGAGFGGLELTTILSEKIGDRLDLTLIDKNDSFFFGFSKLDVMLGFKLPEAVRIPYKSIVKRGVKFRQETITAIDPVSKRVTTQNGIYEADVIVVALGADYNINYTPGLSEGGNEFYSFEGAKRLRQVLPSFTKGHAIIGVTSIPFKCPPAPSEAALLLHDYLTRRGIRNHCTISLVIPFNIPVPPSPDSSRELMKAFAERKINFVPNKWVQAINPQSKTAILDDESEMPFDLFLGIPKHVAPEVVVQGGMTEDGWIPVDKSNLKTKFPNVYAVGDVTTAGVPKAGMFAEGAAKIVAESIIAELDGKELTQTYKGMGSCYVEYGHGKVARVDVDFSGPSPKGIYQEASEKIAAEKREFESIRKARWFGL